MWALRSWGGNLPFFTPKRRREGLDLPLIWFICSFAVQLPPMSSTSVLMVLGHFSSIFLDSKGFCVLLMLAIIDHKL